MPKGKFAGLPRPLATGDVVLLMTAQSAYLDPKSFERSLHDVGWTKVSVELDKRVDTYGISTGMDVVSLDDLDSLADDAEAVSTVDVVGFQVGFE